MSDFSLSRDEVIKQAREAGFIVEPCASPKFIGLRSYKSETNERMRLGSSGELYTRGDDGWMYQVGTVEDVYNAIKERSSHV